MRKTSQLLACRFYKLARTVDSVLIEMNSLRSQFPNADSPRQVACLPSLRHWSYQDQRNIITNSSRAAAWNIFPREEEPQVEQPDGIVYPSPRAKGAVANQTSYFFASPGSRDKYSRELRAINVGIAVNSVIFIGKLAAFVLTSSGTMLAEALHSLADCGNQLLLRKGVTGSHKKPTEQHPYGFHREKYVYALMSAVGIFCLGAGASVVHGLQSIVDPPHLMNLKWSLGVLAFSGIAELFSLGIAFRSIRAGAIEAGESIWKYISRGRDPAVSALFAEDIGAVGGLSIAAIATYATYLTGNPIYDGIGSISVGILMGGIATALIRNNKRFLIGQSMRPEIHNSIIMHLKSDPMVLNVINPKSEELGDGIYRFMAEIQWSGDTVVSKYLSSLGHDAAYGRLQSLSEYKTETLEAQAALQKAKDDAMMFEFGRGVIRTIGEEIDRLEVELRTMVPGLLYVDLETDKGRTEAATNNISAFVKTTKKSIPSPE